MIPFLTRSKKSTAPAHFDVIHGEAVYRVRVRRMPRARRFTLRVNAATRDVTLSMPLRADLISARDFVDRHGAWIATRIDRLGGEIAIAPDIEIPFRGVMHRIIHRPHARGTVWFEQDDAKGPCLVVAGSIDHASRRLRDFLKKEARRALDHAVQHYTEALGIPARRIALKDTKSRWGSCSADGRLNFSWRLILAPPEILDYLAAHEVAHLKELNHSPRYWALVASLYPEYRSAESWLKRHGMNLHRYR